MLHISKKKSENQPINIEIRNAFSSDALAVEMDEMWSYYTYHSLKASKIADLKLE